MQPYEWVRPRVGAEAVAHVRDSAPCEVALVDGDAGAIWAAEGKSRVMFDFPVADGKITEIQLLQDPASLRELEWTDPTD